MAALSARFFGMLRRRILLRRLPDVVIGGSEKPYLRGWFVIGRNRFANAYLHQFLRSDDDRALHDHPWLFNISWLLKGSYIEVVPVDRRHPEGATREILRKEGSFKFRWGGAPHRVMLLPNEQWTEFAKPMVVGELPVWTLFLTGPRIREWGFYCPKGWKHWKDFTNFNTKGHGNDIGPGCGG